MRRLVEAPDQLAQMVEGTVVFADVSGFTRLSERLARRGTEGAEHLVDVINSCFSTLLADAYANGGSLLKFGGDALLLWFEGEHHASWACESAYAMRQTLRRVGRIRAGRAEVAVRMSVGVHSGTFAFFLVGGSHRELLIGGPSAETVVAMEARATAGQILLSPRTAELVPRGCLGAPNGPGVLLARAPAGPSWVPDKDTRQPSDDVMQHCLSTALRAHVLAAPVAPEHRVVTVGFVQIGMLDRLIEQRGPEAAAGALDELVRVAQDGSDRYEICFLGSDIAADGGKLLFSSGAPRSLGDHEERMLLALRHMLDASLELPVRAGVNRGNAFTGEVGPSYRRTYVVMGDVTNLAARLTAKAPYGHMYATPGVLHRSRMSFRVAALEPFAVKGKARAVQAVDVGLAIRAAAPPSVRRLSLIGRDRERATLSSALVAARHGSGSIVELVGETGSGKSRLLSEARELAEGMRFVQCTCEGYSREMPYAAWRDLLRQLIGVGWDDPANVVIARLRELLEREDPELLCWLPLLAIVLDVDVPPTREVRELAPDVRAAKLHEVVLRFLSHALVVPTLVAVEHVHLMDAASAGLCEALARELGSSAWLIVVTRREGYGGLVLDGVPHERIVLELMSPAELDALAHVAGESAELPPHVVQLAVQRAGGSPGFLLDLLAVAAAGSPDALPESIQVAATARIDALDPRDRLVVARASVLGLSFDPQRLSDVLPPDGSDSGAELWDRLSAVFALDPDGRVRFRRPALQEAAYASMPFKLRRTLHAAIASRLMAAREDDPDADPAALSLHFMFADDYARALEFAVLAAERATERFSHSDAARLYRRAISAARAAGMAKDPMRREALGPIWEALGNALRCTGESDAARQALAEAGRLLAGDPNAIARLCHRQAEVVQRSESPTAGVRWLMRGLRAIDDDASIDAAIWRARLHSYLAGMRALQGRWAEAERLCHQAIEEAEQVGEAEALARACYLLDWALVQLGRATEATYSARALEIYELLCKPEEQATVLNNLGGFAYLDGRWEDAVDLYRRAGECSERAGKPGDAAYTDYNIGEIRSDQGHLAEAAGHLERARRVWTATKERQGVAFVDMLLGRLAMRDGRGEEALVLLDSALAEMRRLKLDADADYAQALVGEVEAFVGDPSRALTIAREHLEVDDRDQPLLHRIEGIALARLGQAHAAGEALVKVLDVARARGASYDIAATIDILDQLGVAADEDLLERDLIVRRLQIERLHHPDLAGQGVPAGARRLTVAST